MAYLINVALQIHENVSDLSYNHNDPHDTDWFCEDATNIGLPSMLQLSKNSLISLIL